MPRDKTSMSNPIKSIKLALDHVFNHIIFYQEKHFVDNKAKRRGPDVSASMDAHELKQLIEGSYKIFEARGGVKFPIKEEKKTINFAFASVASTENIKKGEKFSVKNILTKRPGNGDFKVKDYLKILDKSAARDIKKNYQLKNKDINW